MKADASTLEAFVLDAGDTGHRLCLYHAPPRPGTERAVLLHVPAFAEEMNKTRRMVAMTSRALAADGVAVLTTDLYGCGDSAGDFGDARWDHWLDDLHRAHAWLRRRSTAPLWLWSCRAGALLADAFAQRLDERVNHLLWQPVLQGKAVVQQLLRLKAAASWASGDGKAQLQQARNDLAAGRSIEVAGYRLPSELAAALEGARFCPPPDGRGDPGRIAWLEIGASQAPAELSPAAATAMEPWRRAGWSVQAQAVVGPSFWQTVEVEEAPELMAATVNALRSSCSEAPAVLRKEAATP